MLKIYLTTVLSGFLLLILPACAFSDALAGVPAPVSDSIQQVIFPSDEAGEQGLERFVSAEVDRYWTPGEEHIRDMDAALISHLALEDENSILDRYESYKGQFFGYISDGKDYIYGNYFCDNSFPDWQSYMILVGGGGDCFFQAVYDVSAQNIIQLMINGEA